MIGLLFFKNAVYERMNLFGMSIGLMGILPNTWTLLADGNVDLSISITVVNTILACGESCLQKSEIQGKRLEWRINL